MAAKSLLEPNGETEHLPRREQRNLKQRSEILAAALKLFSERGYSCVSMHEIAKEAQFGIGTIYKFFSNKDELYKAIIREMSQRFHEAVLKALDEEQDPLGVIKRHVEVRQKLFSENLPVVRLYFAETSGASFNHRAGLDQEIRRQYDQFLEKVASVFERGIKEKIFRNLDPYQMALALDALINSFLFQMMEDPSRLDEEDSLSIAIEILFEGVLRKT